MTFIRSNRSFVHLFPPPIKNEKFSFFLIAESIFWLNSKISCDLLNNLEMNFIAENLCSDLTRKIGSMACNATFDIFHLKFWRWSGWWNEEKHTHTNAMCFRNLKFDSVFVASPTTLFEWEKKKHRDKRNVQCKFESFMFPIERSENNNNERRWKKPHKFAQ